MGRVKRMTIDLICSNCGDKRSLENTVDDAVEVVKEGWRNHSTNIYCPKCCETWAERNPNIELGSEKSTFWMISNRFYTELHKGAEQ